MLGLAAVSILLAWGYFRRFALSRPPIGVFSLGDVVAMLVGVVLVPYLYLLLPPGVVVALLGLGMLSVLALMAEPVLRVRALRWLVVVALLGADVWVTIGLDAGSPARYLANDLVLLLAVVGTSNLWAQSGLRARDVTVLGAGLALYDLVFTALLPTTDDLFRRLAGLPFAPLVAWPAGTTGQWLAIGLGDLLLAAVCPLALRKAFGRPAGFVGLLVALGVVGGLLALPLAGTFPVMVVLGPLMVIQYIWWIRRRGTERTTWQYLQAEPRPA